MVLTCATTLLGNPQTAGSTKRIVLTFDDSKASHYSTVRPILRKHGFGATFFITEGFTFKSNKTDYMSWEEITELHRQGFEIGNHTKDHIGISADTLGMVRHQIEYINERCLEHGIPRPVSFAYPGNAIHPNGPDLLDALGFTWARRGGAPEFPYEDGRGNAFLPGKDHTRLLPSAGDARPHWTMKDFKRALMTARQGGIPILQFHGVPDRDHPWVSTPPEMFEAYMQHLKEENYTVLALRDLADLIDSTQQPQDAWAIIKKRKAAQEEAYVKAIVLDADTEKPIPARVYIKDQEGRSYYPRSISHLGSSVDYRKQNWINEEATEYHTTLSAGTFSVQLPKGRYQWIIERGKEYHALEREVMISDLQSRSLEFRLKRWINMADRNWFSGDTHVHRSMQELPNVMLAEDLNVAFPLNHWVTHAYQAPVKGDKNLKITQPPTLVKVDDLHVIHPLNTEYEIFSVDGRSHTLGAVFLLGHSKPFERGAPPMQEIAREAHAQGALIDLDKHDWPWSMALIPVMEVDLFELSNNHLWRTEFGFSKWSTPAPSFMELPQNGQTGNEKDWMLYGFQNYYTLLNCGFNLRPTAGTASGVHPVPLGFGRVYVHLEKGFSYDQWFKGLDIGRSFVTTGPMLFAKVDTQLPGFHFLKVNENHQADIAGEILWDHPIESLEIIVNGKVHRRIEGNQESTEPGIWRTSFSVKVPIRNSSWIALRCFGEPSPGRTRFAHTAPWHFRVPGAPLRPSMEEIDFLIHRVLAQIERSRDTLSAEAIAEYQEALRHYRDIKARWMQ
jgi:peptidoglycan/xylan/chitin deacetylase (PgdA/CDA1 family)